MGTDAKSLTSPSAFEREQTGGNDCALLTMNVDLFMQCNRSLRKYIIVKSCDWGEPKLQVISIPGTLIEITPLKMESQNGSIMPDARVSYRYENKKTGKIEEYTLPVHDELVTGANYRQLVPLLFVHHLHQLSLAEQDAVFGIIKGEKSNVEDRDKVAQGILDAFNIMEISIPASLPLSDSIMSIP